MKLISHRGNINGCRPELENTKSYIDLAISKGYDVEIDVWLENGIFYLGHDNAESIVELDWLLDRKAYLWIHCKNFKALSKLLKYDLTIFYHEKESYTIISNKLIWAHNINNVDSKCVIPLLSKKDIEEWELNNVYGVCSDYIGLLNG